MKEPKRIPLDPSTPTAKKAKIFPLNKLFDENILEHTSTNTQNNNENTEESTKT
jgi:hypothetical protein